MDDFRVTDRWEIRNETELSPSADTPAAQMKLLQTQFQGNFRFKEGQRHCWSEEFAMSIGPRDSEQNESEAKRIQDESRPETNYEFLDRETNLLRRLVEAFA
jgi:hypothetical protein